MVDARKLQEVLETSPEVELAVLFGSAARGGTRPDSDVDVGIQMSKGHVHPTASRMAELERALAVAAGRPVDLVDLGEAPPLLRFEIAKHGILLIERRPYAWADFRYHAMQDWWEFAPIARRFQDAAIRRVREKLRGTR